MALPLEVWMQVAAYPGTGAFTRVSSQLRAVWFARNPAETNPHVAYIRRSTRDIIHMPFCIALAAKLHNSPQRHLSCWTHLTVSLQGLSVKEKAVLQVLARASNTVPPDVTDIQLHPRGIVVKGHNGNRRRATPSIPYAGYHCGVMALYLRMVFLPAATRAPANCRRVPSLDDHYTRISLRRPWKPGQVVSVLRSCVGDHAGHRGRTGATRSLKGAFELLLTGTACASAMIAVTRRFGNHPAAALVDDLHRPSMSDVHVWRDTPPVSWP